jgi:hypothetical protein
VIARCRWRCLSTNVVVVIKDDERNVMSPNYANPALDAELAYRREVLEAAMKGTHSRRGAWFRNRRRPR